MLLGFAKSLPAVCLPLLSQCPKAKGCVHPTFSPASCWPRGSLELPELCPLMVGTEWRQVLVMPPSESKKGQIYPALSPFAGAGLALGTMDLREQPPPPGRRELSFLGSRRPRSCHSFCTDFFHYPLGYSPGIWLWNTAHPRMSNPEQERGAARGKTDVAPAQAAMGSLLLSMLSLPCLPTPPNTTRRRWSYGGQSTSTCRRECSR